jgi:hypothetical protein
MIEIKKEFALSDERVAKVIRAKGKHLIHAYKTCTNKNDRFEIILLLLSQVVLINDKPVVPEDLEDLYLEDFTKLAESFGDLGF